MVHDWISALLWVLLKNLTEIGRHVTKKPALGAGKICRFFFFFNFSEKLIENRKKAILSECDVEYLTGGEPHWLGFHYPSPQKLLENRFFTITNNFEEKQNF